MRALCCFLVSSAIRLESARSVYGPYRHQRAIATKGGLLEWPPHSQKKARNENGGRGSEEARCFEGPKAMGGACRAPRLRLRVLSVHTDGDRGGGK